MASKGTSDQLDSREKKEDRDLLANMAILETGETSVLLDLLVALDFQVLLEKEGQMETQVLQVQLG